MVLPWLFRMNGEAVLPLRNRLPQISKHSSIGLATRPQALHSSLRSIRFISSSSIASTQAFFGKNVLAAIGLGCLGFGAYQLNGKEAQALEIDKVTQTRSNNVVPERTTDVRNLMPWQPYSMEDVNITLRASGGSLSRQAPNSDFLRTDYAAVASTIPFEDSYDIRISEPDATRYEWSIMSIFDGHWGSGTAFVLKNFMAEYIIAAMSELQENLYPDAHLEGVASTSKLQSDQVDMAIKTAFLRLDRDIVEGGAQAIIEDRCLNDAMCEVSPSYAGSCALVCLYRHRDQTLRVACTGDSRAVLGRRDADGRWEAVALSTDQTGFNESEVARVRAEHPGEQDIVKDGRLLGLAVTRAFGDGLWKWPKEVAEEAQRRLFGRSPRPGSTSPPYLTAEPVITTTKISPQNGDFLIMASDGLWDNLSSEQAVGLIAQWLQENDPSAVLQPLSLSDLLDLEKVAAPARVEKGPIPRGRPGPKRAYTESIYAQEKRFVVKDDNAAVHLVRNALGGGDEDVLRGRLTVPPPYSRNLGDDITVQVIFFGKNKNSTETASELSATRAYDLETE